MAQGFMLGQLGQASRKSFQARKVPGADVARSARVRMRCRNRVFTEDANILITPKSHRGFPEPSHFADTHPAALARFRHSAFATAHAGWLPEAAR